MDQPKSDADSRSTAPKPPNGLDTPEKRIEYAKMLAAYAAVDDHVRLSLNSLCVGQDQAVLMHRLTRSLRIAWSLELGESET